MERNSSSSLIIPLLFISLISSSSILLANASSRSSLHIVSHGNNGLKAGLLKLCQETTNPELCTQTIEPRYSDNKVDPIKALNINIDATLDQTKKTMEAMDDLLDKNDSSEDLKSSIDICKTQYSSILDSIKETKDALKKNDVENARSKLSAVLSFQGACKDEFSDGSDFPFFDDSESVYKLGGNCLDIIAAILKTLPQTIAPTVPSPPSPYSNVIGTLP